MTATESNPRGVSSVSSAKVMGRDCREKEAFNSDRYPLTFSKMPPFTSLRHRQESEHSQKCNSLSCFCNSSELTHLRYRNYSQWHLPPPGNSSSYRRLRQGR